MGKGVMTYGLLSSGLDSWWLRARGGTLLGFSRWTLERHVADWPVSAQVFDQESIARWWLREGVREPCWDTLSGKPGSGTLLASLLLDRDPEAQLVVASILDSQGAAQEACLLAAWKWLLAFPLDHLIFPLGCPEGNKGVWEEMMAQTRARGISLWAAAGAHPSLPGILEGVQVVADTMLNQEENLLPEWKPRITHWVNTHTLVRSWGSSSTGLAAVWVCTE